MKAVLIVNLDEDTMKDIMDKSELNSIEEVVTQEMNWVVQSGIALKDMFIARED